MDSQRLRGTLEMIAAMILSGSIGYFVLASGQPISTVVFFRCLFGAFVLGGICFGLGYLRPGALTRRLLILAIAGGVALILNWLTLFSAYGRASISIATTVYNTQPFMLVGLSALIAREKVTLVQVIWLVTAFAGMLLIVQVEPAALAEPGQYLVGIGLALVAAFLYAVSALLTRQLAGVPPHLIAFIHTLVGIVMLAPFVGFSSLPSGLSAWAPIITLGVVHTGIMYVLLYGAIQKLPTPVIGALGFVYPIVAIFVDWLAFGQQFGLVQVLGIAIILFAAAGLTLGWRLPSRRERVA